MSDDLIPIADPARRIRRLRDEVIAAVDEVVDSGRYILGEHVEAFEEAFARVAGAAYCVGVGNGTEAISVALRALGVVPGDEVVTASFTPVATVAAIERIGARPVLADVESGSRCLDPEMLGALISPRTRAVVPVHLYGHPAAMDPVLEFARRHDLAVVGDCAQSLGAEYRGVPVGALGDATAFSFYPTKNLGALGDAGAVVTSNAGVARRARSIRQYGWQDRFVSEERGWNARIDEIQAAILLVLLPGLRESNARRQAIAGRYNQAIEKTIGLNAPTTAPGCLHAMHLYVVTCARRGEVRRFLAERGVATDIHYPLAVHQQPAYAGRLGESDRLPVSERLSQSVLTLPLFPELKEEEIDQIVEALFEWRKRSP